MRTPNDNKIPNPQTDVSLRHGRCVRWLHVNGDKGSSYSKRRNALKREQRARWKQMRAVLVAAAAAAGVKAPKTKMVLL